MHKPFKKILQKKEPLIIKYKQLSRPPVHQRTAFFRRCVKRKR